MRPTRSIHLLPLLRAALAVTVVATVALSATAPTGPAGSATTPAQIAPELLAAAGGAATADVSGTVALANATATATSEAIEIMVLFASTAVEENAQGDPVAAASSLQQQAAAGYAAAQTELERLEAVGEISVLNRFWVTSAVLVSATPTTETLDALAALPGATQVIPNFTVTTLDADEITPTAEPSVDSETTTTDGTPVTYGIAKIGADQTWSQDGAEGQGVRVAVLDTGVDATHPDLAGKLVGSGLGDPTYPGGWISFDRAGNPVASVPSDPGSHGTHVAGTVLGGDASGTQIGVAPQAQLMAANVLSGDGGGSMAKVMAGMQWAISPTDSAGDPVGRAADVVNMSLGSSGYDALFIPLVQNLRDAGIFPAIAIGNAPCGDTGTSSPGDVYEAFGVGMTNADDEVDAGSCGAVTSWPAEITEEYGWPTSFVKPDASAPGVAVFSAMPNGLWGESTGTSMATPHVAGAVALIRSAQAGLTVDQIEEALESTAWRPLDAGLGPDTGYGAGRIDVHAAVASVLGDSGILVTVRDSVSGEALAGVTVSYGDRGETWTTDASGQFTAHLEPGSYTLQAGVFGYSDGATGTITVAEGTFSSAEILLTPITTGSITGVVVDTQTGLPLADATVQVVGQPLTATTTAAGEFRFDELPAGDYRVRVTATGYREAVSAEATVTAALTTTINYQLAALARVLVLGDNGGRTADLLSTNGFAAQSSDTLPADFEASDYEVVVWDAPTPVTAEGMAAFLAETEAAGTGVVWLDLGASDDSGISQLHLTTTNPGQRVSGNDRTLTSTGYRVLVEHPIFAGGSLSTDDVAVGDVLTQNAAENGPKFFAAFEDLTGESVTVLAEAVTVAADGTSTDVGDGIAVLQRGDSRNALLSLHGSSAAVDARSWSLASQQLFTNAVTWTAPAAMQAPDPEIILPTVPTPSVPDDDAGTTSTPSTSSTDTAAAAADPVTAPAAVAAAQVAPKPADIPAAPVADIALLTEENTGGLTVSIDSGIASVSIPGATPGDWYFLYVYPTITPVDWIRVNDDGTLRVDIARLSAGSYRFAFVDATGGFAGWVSVVVDGTTVIASRENTVDTPVQTVPAPTESAPFALSDAELLMLTGAALLVLATAGVLLAAARRRPTGGDHA